jgi:hypothetical protein
MASRQIALDPQKELEINVISRSPHVLGYRLWTRTGNTGLWTVVADGDTQDDVPDSKRLGPLATGTALVYWFGIAGNPNSHYRSVLVLSQGGVVLQDGTQIEEGATDASGFAVVEREVSFT